MVVTQPKGCLTSTSSKQPKAPNQRDVILSKRKERPHFKSENQEHKGKRGQLEFRLIHIYLAHQVTYISTANYRISVIPKTHTQLSYLSNT